MSTKVRAGLAVAVYVDNGQGRRLLIASEDRGALNPITLATNRAEARHAIAALKALAEELPPGPGEEPTVTPPPADPIGPDCFGGSDYP